jgi:hypothetical protein
MDLALDLEKLSPEAGEPDAPPIDSAKILTVVTTNIWGDGNQVAIGSPGTLQEIKVQRGDLEGLLRAVTSAGLVSDQAAELEQAIRGDEADPEGESGKPGPGVLKFLGKLALGTTKALGNVGATAGQQLVVAFVRSYYGI